MGVVLIDALHSRRHWQLLLRAGTPHEATQNTDDAQSAPQLWLVSQNGDLREPVFQLLHAIVSWACLFLQRPHPAAELEMTAYHSDDYIRFLKAIRPDNVGEYTKLMQRCKTWQT